MPIAMFNGMNDAIISIDSAGRIVLPKPLREVFDLHPGDQLQVEIEADYLKLRPLNAQPALALRDGLWVHQGTARAPLSAAVEQHRQSRLDDLKRTNARTGRSK